MRTPTSLDSLIEDGVIEDVIRPLLSGKEAQVYLVLSGGEERVAKVYKEAQNRSFKHRASYTEGRGTRNSRDQRAMKKHSRHGRSQDEQTWRSTEVDMLYRLHDAGVRVPTPHHFIDGVLVMELVKDANGEPAPRLGEVDLDLAAAEEIYRVLMREVVKMLCAGVVHGDLSDFNVLLGSDGPVLIDLPQAVDASANQGARRILLRDIGNLDEFVRRYSPQRARTFFGEEMWALYERGELHPDSELTGRYQQAHKPTDVSAMLRELDDVRAIAALRQERAPQLLRSTRKSRRSRITNAPERPLEAGAAAPSPVAAVRPSVVRATTVSVKPSARSDPRPSGQPLAKTTAGDSNRDPGDRPRRKRKRRRGGGQGQDAGRDGAGSPPTPPSRDGAKRIAPPSPIGGRRSPEGKVVGRPPSPAPPGDKAPAPRRRRRRPGSSAQ